MGQEEALPTSPAVVAFSSDHEQGVPKLLLVPDMPKIPRKAPGMGAAGMSPKKASATMALLWEHEQGTPKVAVKPCGVFEGPRKAQAPTRRLSVPPPPGRPAFSGASRAVRPEDDPFLAVYLACTATTPKRRRRS